MGARALLLAGAAKNKLGLLAIDMLAKTGFLSHHDGWRRLRSYSTLLNADTFDPFGYGGRMSLVTDLALANKNFGECVVRERLTARLDYISQRVEFLFKKEKNFNRHIEVSQWIDFFCEDTFGELRQMAYAKGKSIFSPYVTSLVLSSALRIPATQRYFKGYRAKYLLKRLLKKKLPSYPVYQDKGFSNIPFQRYCRSGSLKDFWQEFDWPSFIDKSDAQDLMMNANWFTWNMLTYAIFTKFVLENEKFSGGAENYTQEWKIQ